MKNFTLLSNIVLGIAVAILFYLHFSNCNKCTAPAANRSVSKQNGNFKIAYFDLDSLENNFNYYKQVAKDLGNSEQQKRIELASKKDAYVAKVKEYQAKGQGMSQNELAAAQQEIAQREKDYTQDEQQKFIISNSADLVYYKDSAYDITNDLVKGLNELYKSKK
jgi:outer membrane protein